ncbi:aspartate kinase [Oceanospirillum maris]|uniref:aspartate kinase n=1 Tax=Oceanospirillum maris TaxID=64977 RepID=UPI0003F73D24|nr:aspartate kinase [Oceanospirillum maris]
MKSHTVEKIGGTSMSDYAAVRDNIIFHKQAQKEGYQRIFVVSAYGGVTDLLLEHKKSDKTGVYSSFAGAEDGSVWRQKIAQLRAKLFAINEELFEDTPLCQRANAFIGERLDETEQTLNDLERVCEHGHFALNDHLITVREMLASLGEAHSAWNMAELLKRDGINTVFVDLTGWNAEKHLLLDARIENAFKDIDLATCLPIATGYAHCTEGLMKSFNRGYSEMVFSRIAVLTDAREAIIHKEYHLSSADPRLVGIGNAVPIGRTNYDVADQLANLGMEAIHPKAAKGLRQKCLPLRVMNTFEPDHAGTLITVEYVSEKPSVEIIAGRQNVYALEFFDQDMMGSMSRYGRDLLGIIERFKVPLISKHNNANTLTHYLVSNLKNIKRMQNAIQELFPNCEMRLQKVSIVSAIGSDMQVPGILAKTVNALAAANISVLALQQSMRQVDIQFIVSDDDYDLAVQSLHRSLIEVHDHGEAICAA